MRAARLTAFGDPPTFELVEIADPIPGEGEVVVDIVAAALNRRDPWIWLTPGYCPLPVTLGSDGAGVVSTVGPNVEAVAPGDEVSIDPTLGWGADEGCPTDAFDILGVPTDGTFAERVVVPAANVAPRPSRLSWEECGALSLAGLTAWRAAITCAQAGPGRELLVTGAGGGVASFAVQIASAVGSRVWVTSSSDEKLARARTLGAVGGFRYDDPDWPDRARAATGGRGFDAAIDSYGATGAWEQCLRALRRGGTLVSYGDTGGAETTVTVAEVYWEWRRVLGTSMGSPREFRAMLDHVRTAAWRPVVDRVYPLDDIALAARRLGEPDRFGKVVLRVR
jgi:NADPH:quinone reductase-like Zn-dependent oxidoreductase